MASRFTIGLKGMLVLILITAAGCTGNRVEDADSASLSLKETSLEEAPVAAKAIAEESSTPGAADAVDVAGAADESVESTAEEPGYVGYPYMGQTETGEEVYYIYGEFITCVDAASDCEHLVKVDFVQVDSASNALQGSLVANCTDNALAEVVLDNDLVSYRTTPTDEAMSNVLNLACNGERGDLLFTEETAFVDANSLIPQGIEEGMRYAEVRALLIEQGWVPKAVTLDHYTLLEQRMYDAGFEEVLGCSGSGLCRFEFDYQDTSVLGSGDALVAITYLENDQPYLSILNIDVSAAPD
ncbi:hypothetical protein PN498_22485 [Oscillatoria sp. CS-180]|uniref:hypothetical protein n=1 Tax=Oscillatoria sp. CS-180 TaxID=3021720 RepID=UPI00232E8D1E|nr:hypothetical protein [Oscillatoria sp. CS-180]MDB9528777.1 hypothetical protein [Oscillatoria sp. CS-180]